ncbi:MAG: DUF1206 domain-containing protein [Phormidesmis sp. RL_2_1]|nr:DUF1206 domain-containing protein [Phormidesmis sp. RL_2_1]
MAILPKTRQHLEQWIEWYARIGYSAKGVIYGTLGLLALAQAMDLRMGKAVGSEGALRAIAAQPWGRGMLMVLTISLGGYITWRLIQAILDPEHKASCQGKDILRRFSYACSGIAYAGVAYSAIKILTFSATSTGKTPEQWALEIILQPFGRYLLGTIGLSIFGIGCYYFYRAAKADFRKRFNRHAMSSVAKTWATIAGRFGIAARGFVYIVIGSYGVRAAYEFEPEMIKTTEDVLATFDNNPTDEWILAILGVGFIAYGIHMGFQAAYRSIAPL